MNQVVFPPVLIGSPDPTLCELAAKQTSWRSKLKSFFKQAITYTVLASLQLGTLVQTKEAYAQYVQYGGQPTNGQVNGQPNYGYVAPVAGAISGYTNDGTLFMGGQRIGNPHQILHDAQIPAFMTITGFRATYSNVNDPLAPNYGQGTLAQMETQATTGSDASVLFNRVYLTPNNPYPVVPAGTHNNYQTYQNALTAAQAANYLLTNADDGKTYAFKTLTASSRQAADLLIRELPNTSQFKSYADPNGGAVLMRVSQNGDAVALAAYLATVKPYDYSWQPNFGTTFGQNGGQNPYGSWANSNNFAPDYSEGAGPAQSFQAFIKQLQDDAVANDKRVRSQTSANSLDLSGVNPNSLFGEGYNLFEYGSNSNPNRDLENDFLRRLQAGQLSAGSADYLEASRIAQERYRIAYATRLETNKPLQYSVADAQRKANELQLSGINANELFGQGFDLFKYNPALRANGAAENDLLARLQSGQLQAGSSEYQQAAEIAQQRLRDAYAQSLSPPPPKKVSKWKLIAGAVVGAVLTFVTAGAAAPFIGAALGVGSTVASAIAGVVASAVGTIASTTITTGSLSQGLKAGGKALISGGVKAIVASAIGMGFVGDILGAAAGQTVAYGGSFGDNLKGAVIGAAVTYVADGVGKQVAGAIKDAGLGAVGTELAHGALGCVTGMIRSQSGSGCVPGAAGAVAGHLIAPVIYGTGFDPLGTGTVQGIKDSADFFSGVVGGAVAAAVGDTDQVNQNYGLGSAAGSNAAANNALSATLRLGVTVCSKSPVCLASIGGELGVKALSASVIAYMAANPGVTQSSAEAIVISGFISKGIVNGVYTAAKTVIEVATGSTITGTPIDQPKPSGTPPFPVTPDNQPNNTGNQNPVTAGGSNNTGGTQIEQPNGSTIVGGGYGAGAGVTINPVTLNLNGQDQIVNLPSIVEPDKATHILTGDKTGGGHLWPGLPGKTPFPQSWNADKVLGLISDVATDPNASKVVQSDGRIRYEGVRDGVLIRVVVEPPSKGGRVVTAFPPDLPRNPK